MGLLIKAVNKLFEKIYWPICRSYSRYFIKDRPADVIYRFLCRFYFWWRHGYWPHIKNPRSFSEKLWNHMLFKRDPLFTIVSDKWLMRDYVAKKIAKDYLIPLLWHGNNPDEIPFDELPNKFIIKTTHGCKSNFIVNDKTKLDRAFINKQLNKWLAENFCLDKSCGIEWAYKNIKPGIIVESLLEDNGEIPLDYKFFCFSGRVEYLLIVFDRFGDLAEKHFDRNFKPLDLWNGAKQYQGEVYRPDSYQEMLKLAEAVSDEFDFIRVDMYYVNKKIYFGEFTLYPSGGNARFIPRKYDFIFGEDWRLK